MLLRVEAEAFLDVCDVFDSQCSAVSLGLALVDRSESNGGADVDEGGLVTCPSGH